MRPIENNGIHPLEILFERGEEYSKTTIELFKLKILDKASGLVSAIILNIIITVIFSIFFLMGTIGVAFWLGEMLGNMSYGFFIVAGFYGISGVLIYSFMHKWLKGVLGDFIVKHILK